MYANLERKLDSAKEMDAPFKILLSEDRATAGDEDKTKSSFPPCRHLRAAATTYHVKLWHLGHKLLFVRCKASLFQFGQLRLHPHPFAAGRSLA